MLKVSPRPKSSFASGPVGSRRRTGARRSVMLLGAGGAMALLVAAYIDGGEEPIHAIAQPLAVPDQGASS